MVNLRTESKSASSKSEAAILPTLILERSKLIEAVTTLARGELTRTRASREYRLLNTILNLDACSAVE